MTESDNHGTHRYHSISFAKPYQKLSFEEIRLQDYEAGTPHTPAFPPEGHARTSALKQYVVRSLQSTREPANIARDLGTAMLSFLVGEEEVQYTLHENVITSRSAFVRMALRGDWKEAKEQVIKLPDEDPVAFKVY